MNGGHKLTVEAQKLETPQAPSLRVVYRTSPALIVPNLASNVLGFTPEGPRVRDGFL